MSDPTAKPPAVSPDEKRGGPSPASEPSGVASANASASPPTRSGKKVKVKAVNQIIHGKTTIQPGQVFTADAEDANPLLAIGAVEYYPARPEDSAHARSEAAVAARQNTGDQPGSESPFKVESV